MRGAVRAVVVGALAVMCCACSGSDSFKLVSVSMCPTLGPGDHVKTSSVNELHRGDVVIARTPQELSGERTPTAATAVTRIVAIPGDTITTQGGYLLLNGKPANEPWIGAASTPNYFPQ